MSENYWVISFENFKTGNFYFIDSLGKGITTKYHQKFARIYDELKKIQCL